MSDTTPTPADVAPKPVAQSAADSPTGTANPPNGSKASRSDESTRLPEDHPLVRAYNAQKEEIKNLKGKAARLDELEEASKTEAEKAEERLRAAEGRARDLEAANDRKDMALEYSLTSEDAALLDGVTDIEVMRRIASRIAERAREDAAPRSPRPSAAQRQGNAPAENKDAVARAFFGI